ncbi:hypothetical protein C8R44DRAFT_821499 [Mycena epipterygia]|nr:hypothetical protein C8R44DRAFT_821499 [Mycena epipterygia]
MLPSSAPICGFHARQHLGFCVPTRQHTSNTLPKSLNRRCRVVSSPRHSLSNVVHIPQVANSRPLPRCHVGPDPSGFNYGVDDAPSLRCPLRRRLFVATPLIGPHRLMSSLPPPHGVYDLPAWPCRRLDRTTPNSRDPAPRRLPCRRRAHRLPFCRKRHPLLRRLRAVDASAPRYIALPASSRLWCSRERTWTSLTTCPRRPAATCIPQSPTVTVNMSERIRSRAQILDVRLTLVAR